MSTRDSPSAVHECTVLNLLHSAGSVFVGHRNLHVCRLIDSGIFWSRALAETQPFYLVGGVARPSGSCRYTALMVNEFNGLKFTCGENATFCLYTGQELLDERSLGSR
jgi:hypothetical protein